MKKVTEVTELLNSASDLWAFLKTQSGLDPDYYDKDLVTELQLKLFKSSSEDMVNDLITQQITIEDLVIAFFQVTEPYVEMMIDLLRMFEQAGAKETDKNLEVIFRFDENLPDLNFNLSHFREWIVEWTKTIDIRLAILWDSELLWQLHRALLMQPRSLNMRVIDADIRRWLDLYMKDRIWPQLQPSPPRTGNSRLDEQFAKAWNVWRIVVHESSKYDRDTLHEFGFRSTSAASTGNRQGGVWSPNLLGRIDTDDWAGVFAQNAYYQAETIAALAPAEQERKASELGNALNDVFKLAPKKEVKTEALVRKLTEFLKLPIWQRRHELYSAWISTQLLDALGKKFVRIHHVDGTLMFSFSGTHLATADTFIPRLHLWAELRSPLPNPVGKVRTKAIQPDYSLIADPVSNPEASILEVECKQHRRPSINDFAAALIDYARGRPNAHVILVNYGPADQSILNRVDPNVRERTSLIGRMRPGSYQAQKQFEQIVQQVLAKQNKSQAEMESLLQLTTELIRRVNEALEIEEYIRLIVSDIESIKAKLSIEIFVVGREIDPGLGQARWVLENLVGKVERLKERWNSVSSNLEQAVEKVSRIIVASREHRR